MGKNKKLKLNDLEIQSFVTTKTQDNNIKGGASWWPSCIGFPCTVNNSGFCQCHTNRPGTQCPGVCSDGGPNCASGVLNGCSADCEPDNK